MWSVVAGAAVLLSGVGTPTAAAGGYVDKRVRACLPAAGGGCTVGAVVEYWHKPGSNSRGVGWVYASRAPVRQGATYRARWTYRTPGHSTQVGGGWKRATVRGDFAETHWGRGGHTGRTLPRNTVICVEFKGMRNHACVTLK
jgi:hypothetical protein